MFYYFTFDQNHYHPETNENLKDYYVKLKGSYIETRNIMFKIFKKKWSFQYTEKEFKKFIKFFPKGELKNMRGVLNE